MSEEKKTLTLDDPVEPETLAKFNEFQLAKQQLALQLLALEQDKLEILRAAKRVEDQDQRLFEAVLVARGESPKMLVDINGETGKITRMDPKD